MIAVVTTEKCERQFQKAYKVGGDILCICAARQLCLVNDLAVERGDIKTECRPGQVIDGDRPVLPHTQHLCAPPDLLLHILAVYDDAGFTERIGDLAHRDKAETGQCGNLLLGNVFLPRNRLQNDSDMIALD